ncbi:MAG TPA: hypothetical protein IAC50_09645 [Candidatus Copromorpha excrementigallinarum]|uniref:Uncharacterized protein n=1 Tax=Candidatus Allocopromorpha excrementigallinarum TaxID=2840742 RepID=A0A9D1I1W5_9FIRM|nr:hypothetical protein [Candidatus Copromorpha excrementigallinarum]
MAAEAGFYESRKEQKRLKTIEKRISSVEEEFDNRYREFPEMLFMEETIRWEGAAKLIFITALRDVNFTWGGIRDYGFIRLCRKWTDENQIHTLTPADAAEMVKSILPSYMWEQLEEELAAMELFQEG